jgi:hypothetical protein
LSSSFEKTLKCDPQGHLHRFSVSPRGFIFGLSNAETEKTHVFGIGLYCIYSEPDTSISTLLPWLARKSTISDLDLQMQKMFFFSFSSIQPNILCIKDIFGGISLLRQYRILVSLSKDITCVFSQESECFHL